MPPKAAESNDLDMVKALTDRLEELNATAAEFQVMVDEGEKKLREAARNAPPRPLTLRQMRALDRGDEVRTPITGSDRDYEELQDEMDRLEQSIEESEWTRQTTSISLFDENKLVKEIDKQHQKMADLRRYVTFLESMSEVRDSHQEARDELRARNKQAVELKTALRVMKAAQDLSISLDELQTESVPIAAAHLPHILGRGRAALKELESECGVAIDMRPAPRPTREEREANEGGGGGRRGERSVGRSGPRPMVALVMGPEHGVAEVRERLFALQRSVVEFLPLTQQQYDYISSARNAISDLEAEFAVTSVLQRGRDGPEHRGIRLRGEGQQVSDATAQLDQMLRTLTNRTITVDGKLRSAIIGTKGAAIRALEDDSGASFKLVDAAEGIGTSAGRGKVRRSAKAQVLISGPAGAVKKGEKLLQEVLDANTEKDEHVDMSKLAGSSVLRGTLLRQLGPKARGVSLELDQKGTPRLKLTGTKERLLAAREALDNIMVEFELNHQTDSLEMTHDFHAGLVIGKGGETVRELEKTTGAQVRVDAKSKLVTFEGTAETVAAAKEAVDALFKSNAEGGIDIDLKDVGLVLGARGALVRDIEKRTGARVTVMKGGGMSGGKGGNKNGGKGNNKSHKRTTVRVRGTPEQVEAAKQEVVAAVHGSAEKFLLELDEKNGMGAVIGKQGRNVRKLEEEFGVKIEAPVRGRRLLRVSGDENKVKEATKALKRLSEDTVRETHEVTVKARNLGILFGKKGASIKELQALYPGARIQVQSKSKGKGRARGDDDVKVRIVGGQHTAAEMLAAVTDMTEETEEAVEVGSSTSLGGIVGSGGKRIRELQREVGVSLRVGKSGNIDVKGTKRAVALAKARLAELIAKNQSGEIDIPRADLMLILGQKGKTVRDIQQKTGASITLVKAPVENPATKKKNKASKEAKRGTPTPASARSCSIKGTAEQVAAAKKMLLEAIQGSDNNALLEFDRAGAVGSIIGKGGQRIKRIAELHNVTIDIPSRARQLVRVQGEPQNVAAAKEAIERIVEDTVRDEKTIKIKRRSIGLLFGKGGGTINALQDTFLVRITVSNAKTTGAANTKSAEDKANKTEKAEKAEKVKDASKDGKRDRKKRQRKGEKGTPENKPETTTDKKSGSGVAGAGAGEDAEVDVTVKGGAKGVQCAIEAIEGLTTEAEHTQRLSSYHTNLLSPSHPRGHIRQLQREAGVQLKLKGSEIFIRGPRTKVEAGRRALDAFLDANATLSFEIDGEDAGFLLGPIGLPKMQALQKSKSCGIRIERPVSRERVKKGERAPRAQGPATIVIRGEKNNLGAARSAVEALMASNVREDVDLDDQHFGTVVGKGGSTIQHIEHESGARVTLDRKNSRARLSGELQQVKQAKALIRALVAGNTPTVVEIDSKDVPRVIGPKGATIQKLQKDSGARVQVDRGDEGYSSIKILGAPENRAKAEVALRAVLGKTEEVPLPHGAAGTVIGKKGETIRKLQSDSGASINIDRDSSVVKVRGTPEEIAVAKAALEKLLAAHHSSEPVYVGEEGVPLIIGRGGETIRNLQSESGARIDIDRDAGNVYVSGSPEQVAKGVELIRALFLGRQGGEDAGGREIEVGPEGVPLIIGRGGETIRNLQNESGARIDIDRQSSTVYVSGEDEEVEAAVAAIEALLAEQKAAEEAEQQERRERQKRNAEDRAQREAAEAEESVAQKSHTSKYPTFIPGLDPAIAEAGQPLTKNQRRRMRKRAEKEAMAPPAPVHALAPAPAPEAPNQVHKEKRKQRAQQAQQAPLLTPSKVEATPYATQQSGATAEPAPATDFDELLRLAARGQADAIRNLLTWNPKA